MKIKIQFFIRLYFIFAIISSKFARIHTSRRHSCTTTDVCISKALMICESFNFMSRYVCAVKHNSILNRANSVHSFFVWYQIELKLFLFRMSLNLRYLLILFNNSARTRIDILNLLLILSINFIFHLLLYKQSLINVFIN